MRRRSWMAVPLVLALLAAACGGDGADPVTDDADDAPSPAAAVPVAERTEPDPGVDPRLAGDPMLGFGTDLLGAVAERADQGANVILSPASVATALAMLEPGTVDRATMQLRALLGIDDPGGLDPFVADQTEEGGFSLLDGGEVTVPLMHGAGDGSARGDGWVAATKAYVGGLAAQFVLPDEGRFDEVAADLPVVFEELDRSDAGGGELVLPRFETRTEAGLNEPLQSLGLTAPFEGGQLLGLADDPSLAVTDVLHQTWVAMDEEGTEAAAATAVVIEETSAPAGEPVPVVLDRPFLFRIVDPATGATLFLGRVMDPTT